jgi:hypothetical protein
LSRAWRGCWSGAWLFAGVPVLRGCCGRGCGLVARRRRAFPAGCGREPGGGAAVAVVLPGLGGGEDALVADGYQATGPEHDGR